MGGGGLVIYEIAWGIMFASKAEQLLFEDFFFNPIYNQNEKAWMIEYYKAAVGLRCAPVAYSVYIYISNVVEKKEIYIVAIALIIVGGRNNNQSSTQFFVLISKFDPIIKI